MDTPGIATLALALIALLAVLANQYRQRRHDRLSMAPALVFHCDTSPGEAIRGLWLQNSGMGPARVTGTRLKLDGEAVGPPTPETWLRVLDGLGVARGDWLTMNVLPDPTTVGPGEKVKVLCLTSPTAPKEHEALLLAMLSRLAVECEYESVYGDENTSDWAFDSEPVEDAVLERLGRKVREGVQDRAGFEF